MSEIIWTSTEAEAVTGGKSTREWCASGVSMNLSELKPGDLYVATPEDDLNAVFTKGAAAAMVSSRYNHDHDFPLFQVGSAYQALQDLARAARFKTHAQIISIQGREARQKIRNILSLKSPVYEGGRHLSLGLAGLPETIDYGLFGSSPAVQPDIAVITNCAKSNRDTLFETMPVHGTVLINTDGDDFLPVIARARAAGIQHIYTFGAHEAADARMLGVVSASNGVRVSLKVFEEEYTFTMSDHKPLCPSFMAALLIFKITAEPLPSVIKCLEQGGMAHMQGGNIALIEPEAMLPQAVFKVTNMIDLGFGRQTAVLDNLGNFARQSLCFPKKDLAIPRKLEGLNLMYTNKTIGAVRNAQEAIRRTHRSAGLEAISPDAVVPGDFVVFKDIRKKSKAVFSEALRLVNPKKVKADYAL